MGTATGNPTWEDYPSTNTPITADRLNRIETAIDDATLAASTVQIGGRNLLPRFTDPRWTVNPANQVEDYSLFNPGTSGTIGETTLNLDVEPDTDYTFSGHTDRGRVILRGRVGEGAWSSFTGYLMGRYVRTFNTGEYTEVRVILDRASTVTEDTRHWNLKLEKGNHATDWTPAPEDIGVNPDTAQWAAPHSLALELADARDTAAARTIVGAGRPDIPATLTPDVAALVSAASSGAEFRSTDGPQGAWVWRKRGSTWVCVEGDTGWVELPVPETPGVIVPVPQPAMIRRTTYAVELLIDRLSFTEDYAYATLEIAIPTGFRVERSVYLPNIAYASSTSKSLFLTGSGILRFNTGGTSTDYRTQQFWTPLPTWPTTLTF